jgi:hypothetical protein
MMNESFTHSIGAAPAIVAVGDEVEDFAQALVDFNDNDTILMDDGLLAKYVQICDTRCV